MKTIILKFGGASLASPDNFLTIADIIIERSRGYDRVGVVVSAMGSMTDNLISLAERVHPNPPRREKDMLITVGERISSSLLSMALSAKGHNAVSFTGSQAGIITTKAHNNARIVDVNPYRLIPHLEKQKIVIIAGFQGLSLRKEITTLGRGGSDTTAVALGAALDADGVEFFKDVDGIYDKDPNIHDDAVLHAKLSYREALEIAKNSEHEVLHSRCITLAEKNCLPLRVFSFRTALSSGVEGTLIEDSGGCRGEAPQYEVLAYSG